MGGKIILKIHRYAELTQPCTSKSKIVRSSRRRLGDGEMKEKGNTMPGGKVSILTSALQRSVSLAHEVSSFLSSVGECIL